MILDKKAVSIRRKGAPPTPSFFLPVLLIGGLMLLTRRKKR